MGAVVDVHKALFYHRRGRGIGVVAVNSLRLLRMKHFHVMDDSTAV